MRLVFLLLVLLTAQVQAQSPGVSPHAAALVAAERAFAAYAAAHGTRAAFLANFGEDAVLFRPGPVNALTYLQEQPDRPGLLTWHPAFADVAASGELGYTTGPSAFQPDPAQDSVDYGHFVSVWKRQPDGAWKVVLDVGISHEGQASSDTTVAYGPLARLGEPSEAPSDTAGLPKALRDLEAALTEAARRGSMTAYVVRAAPDVRVYRDGMLPLVGRGSVMAYLDAQDEVITWSPLHADVAQSGDLGYTYGAYRRTTNEGGGAETGHYVHVWRKLPGGPWELAVDVLNPTPLWRLAP